MLINERIERSIDIVLDIMAYNAFISGFPGFTRIQKRDFKRTFPRIIDGKADQIFA